jgi:phage gpG-like protein
MADFGIKIDKDNTDKVIAEMKLAKLRALEIIGQNAEKFAKAICPVGTVESTGKKGYRGGTLKGSITHNATDESVEIGTDVEYAPYVELGTGPHFQAPPDWEQFDVPTPSGVGHSYVHPRPYLRPAIEEHLAEYKDIIKQELGG